MGGPKAEGILLLNVQTAVDMHRGVAQVARATARMLSSPHVALPRNLTMDADAPTMDAEWMHHSKHFIK